MIMMYRVFHFLLIHSSIIEGETVTITLIPSEAILTNISVWLSVIEDNGDFIRGILDDAPKTMAPFTTTQRMIETDDDQIDEADGSFKVRVLEDPLQLDRYVGYDATSNPYGEITINVADNDSPLITISAVSDSISEGEIAEFTLTADQATANQLRIYVSVENEIGDFLTATVPTFQDMLEQETVASINIQTEDDNLDEENGRIKVTLENGANYVIPSATAIGYSASMKVLDNENSELTLSADNSAVVEGEVVTFTISTSPAPAIAIKVLFSVDEDNYDFIQGTTVPVELTIAAGVGSISRPVRTHDDQVNESDGSITARISLVAESTGVYTIPTGKSSITVQVKDNDAPEISISSQLTSIEEGQNAVFTIHSSKVSISNLSINIRVDQGLSNFLSSTVHPPIDFGLGLTEIPLEIGTINDAEDEVDGSITVEIVAGSYYKIAESPDNIESIAITDNDLPEITITTTQNSIIEGETTTFTLSSSTPTPSKIMVNLNVSESGSFISGAKPSTGEIRANTNSIDLEILTSDDNVVELNGRITVTVLAGSNYITRSPTNEKFVNVADDDIELTLVQTGPTSVIEGEDISFQFSSSQTIITPKVVNILITEVGSFLSDPKPTFHQLTSAPSSMMLTLRTDDDSIDETDGSITLELLSGTDYTLGSIIVYSINVTDNDVPEISIIGGESIIEGEDAIFTLSTNLLPFIDLEIGILLSDEGNFLNESDLTKMIQFSSTAPNLFVSFPVKTRGSVPAGNEIGKIIAAVRSGENYTVSSRNARAEVNVNGPTGVLLTITGGREIIEGDDAIFTISANQALVEDLPITIDLSEEGNFIEGSNYTRTTTLTRINPDLSTIILVKTEQDDIGENDGKIIGIIRNSSLFSLTSSSRRGEVVVRDDDDKVNLTISPSSSLSIDEGALAKFEFSSSKPILASVIVNIAIVDPGNYILGRISTTHLLTSDSDTLILAIPTHDDQIQELNNFISVQILAGIGYSIGEPSYAKTYVIDNDSITISVSARETSVEEGQPALFRFSSNKPVDEVVNLILEVDDGDSNFITESFKENIPKIELAIGSDEEFLNVPTLDDSFDEENGSVFVKVLSGENYSADPISNLAFVEIHDNDIPRVSVTGVNSVISKGELGSFWFDFSTPLEQPVTLKIRFSQTGDVIIGQLGELALPLEIGTMRVIHEFETKSEIAENEDCIVRMEILIGQGYTVADSPDNRAEILVVDNEKPLISIMAVTSSVSEGSVASFQIFASNEVSNNQQIQIEIDDPNNSIAGDSPSNVMIEQNQLQTILSLLTVDNDQLNTESVITVTVIPNELYRINEAARSAQVHVMDNDTNFREINESRLNALNISVLPEMLRAKQSNKVSLLSSRVEQAFEVIREPTFNLNNHQTITDILSFSGHTINNEEMNLAEMLENSSFSVTAFPGPNESNPATLWASIGDNRKLRVGDDDDLIKWEGDVIGAQFGFDSYFNEKILFGLGMTYFQGKADYQGTDIFGYFRGKYQNWSTGLQPFLAYRTSGGVSEWWATAGFGQGEVRILHKDLSEKVSFTQHINTAIGGRYSLFSYDSIRGNEKAELDLQGEIWSARELLGGKVFYFERKVVDVSRAKLRLEGSMWQQLESGLIKKPTFTIGALWDGGDGKTGFGIEAGAGIFVEETDYFTFTVDGGLTLFHSGSLQEWFAQGLLRFDRYRDGLGFQVATNSTFGHAQSIFEYDYNDLSLANHQQPNSFQFSAEVGYGFEVLQNSSNVVPYLGFEINQDVSSIFKLGGRFGSGTDFQIGIEGRREEQFEGEVGYGVKLETKFKW